MIYFITGPAGSGKTHYIYDIIKNNSEKQAVLFVPEQASFETERDIIEILGAKNQYAVETLSFKRFCEKFNSKYKVIKEEVISEIGRTVLMSSALKACSGHLEIFKKNSNDFKFCQTLIQLYEQVKMFALTTEDLQKASAVASSTLKSKLSDISLIFTQYEAGLSGEYYDPADKMTKVSDALKEHKYFENKVVFFDSFKGFTNQQEKIVEQIINQADDVYFAFTYDKNRKSGIDSPFENINLLIEKIKKIARSFDKKVASEINLTNSYRLQTNELQFLEKAIYSNEDLSFDENNENVKIFAGNDVYEEADFVAKEIHRLVREQNYRFRDFAVVARNIEDYQTAIEMAFNKRKIDFYTDRRRPAANKSVFRLARYALKSAQTLSSDDIIALLKTGIAGLSNKQISELENYVDIWQIKKDWENVWTGDTLGVTSKTENSQKRKDYINDLRKQVITPLLNLSQRLKTAKTATEKCDALFDYTEQIDISRNLYSLIKKLKAENDFDLAESERQSFDAFINVLDQIHMSVGNSEISTREFAELFDSAVNACDIGEIPQRLDEVIVGAADRIRPKSPKITFILGANYGIFPREISTNSIFTEEEFGVLSSCGCTLKNDGIFERSDEQYLVYSLLCSPSEKIYITYSQNDSSGQKSECSEIVNAISKMFDNFECKLNNDIDCIENECDAVRFLQKADKDSDITLEKSTAIARFNDTISLSASKIDVYYQCRFRYLCQYILKLKPLKTASIDVLERGTIVHYVLEKLVEQYANKLDEILQMPEEELINQISLLVDECLEVYKEGREFTKNEIFSQKKLIKNIYILVIKLFNELKNTDFTVLKTEMKIGGDNADIPALEIDLKDGRKICINGYIDRTDIYKNSDGQYLRIIDYKTGAKTLKISDVLHGHNLQMILYLYAVIKAMRCQGTDVFPAGVYYMPANAKYISTEKNATDEVNGKLLDTLRCDGITISNQEVIDAMDKTTNKMYSPVKIKYKKLDPEALFENDDFDLICKKLEVLLRDMGNGLFEKDFNAEPVKTTSAKSSTCDYCDYRAICGRETDEPLKEIKTLKNTEALENLRKGNKK